MSEDEIKARFRAEMWWCHFPKLWAKVANVVKLQRDRDYYDAELNKIRSQYVKRGRPRLQAA